MAGVIATYARPGDGAPRRWARDDIRDDGWRRAATDAETIFSRAMMCGIELESLRGREGVRIDKAQRVDPLCSASNPKMTPAPVSMID